MANYQWRTNFNRISGGYPGEDVGVIGGDTQWHTTDATSGTAIAEYYYRDSDVAQDANSTRVVVTVQDTWTASIDGHNRLTINVTSVIARIRRDDSRGTGGGGLARHIYIRRSESDPVIWSTLDPTTSVHEIAVNISLGTYSFTIEPGQGASRSTVYYRSTTNGYENVPIPNIYTDIFAIGVEFKNILPADYRPGKIWSGTAWLSHNRDAGFEKIYTNTSNTREMRTLNGGVGTGNPPSIHNERWLNERLIGNE